MNQQNWKALILHELSHVYICKFCNNKHNKNFWKVYEDMIRRFLPNYKLTESELRYKNISISTNSYYSIKYQEGIFL